MEFIQLKCPNCQATLDAEDTLDTIFCKYCGTRIVVADQSKDIIEAKTKLKMADKQLEMEKERHRQEMEKKEFENRESNKIMYILLGLVVAGMIALCKMANLF
jgi:DNA-directed RNA polymerase subunit RPC12/RpoP